MITGIQADSSVPSDRRVTWAADLPGTEPLTRNGLSQEAARLRDCLGLPIELLAPPRESTPGALQQDSLAVNRLIAGRAADEGCKSFLARHLPAEMLAAVEPWFHLRFSPLWTREETPELLRDGLGGLKSQWWQRARSREPWTSALHALQSGQDFAAIWKDLPGSDFDAEGRGKDYTVGMEYFQAARSFGVETLMALLGVFDKDGIYLDVLGGDGYLLRLVEARRKLREKRLLVLELAPGLLGAGDNLAAAGDAVRSLERRAPGLVVLAAESVVAGQDGPRRVWAMMVRDGVLSGAELSVPAQELAGLAQAPSVHWLRGPAVRSADDFWRTVAVFLENELTPPVGPVIVTNDLSAHMFLSAGFWGFPTREDAGRLSRTFHPGSLDGVLYAYGTHHVAAIDPAIRESLTVLKPGGRIVVHDFIDEGRIGGWFHEVVDRYSRTGHDFPHLGPIELAVTLLTAGFRDISLYEMEDPFIFAVPEGGDADARDVACSYLLGMYGMVEKLGSDRERFEDLVRERLSYPEIGNEPVFTRDLVYIPRRAVVATARRPAQDGDGGFSSSDLTMIANLRRLLQLELQDIATTEDLPPRVAASWFDGKGGRWGLSPKRQEEWESWLKSLPSGALGTGF